ncbi:MAG: hypothetical protein CMJ90_03070 [Planctomycetes bacterium]|nr:hypothetical protein [Planctomycetota bacterium]
MSPVTAPIAKPLAWIEGTVLSPDVARVPLEDRGVLFGESAYEAVLTRSGRVFALEPHLRRLERSATGAGICPAAFRDRIRGAVDALLEAGGEGDGLLYLHVTGGAAPREHVPAVAQSASDVAEAAYGWPALAVDDKASSEHRGTDVV